MREDQLDPDDPSGPESGSGFCHLHLSLLTDHQTEQLSLDVVESALYRCVLHELFDAEKSKNRCYKSDSDPGPIFIKRLRITLRVNED